MATQSLKSAIDTRVIPERAILQAGARFGNPGAEYCRGMHNLRHDVYGRPANQNTLPVLDSACSPFTVNTVQAHLSRESVERPVLPGCASGNRGGGDLMGKGRDMMPKNLYASFTPARGNFDRVYPTANNLPPHESYGTPSPLHKMTMYAGSHNASDRVYRG